MYQFSIDRSGHCRAFSNTVGQTLMLPQKTIIWIIPISISNTVSDNCLLHSNMGLHKYFAFSWTDSSLYMKGLLKEKVVVKLV